MDASLRNENQHLLMEINIVFLLQGVAGVCQNLWMARTKMGRGCCYQNIYCTKTIYFQLNFGIVVYSLVHKSYYRRDLTSLKMTAIIAIIPFPKKWLCLVNLLHLKMQWLVMRISNCDRQMKDGIELNLYLEYPPLCCLF